MASSSVDSSSRVLLNREKRSKKMKWPTEKPWKKGKKAKKKKKKNKWPTAKPAKKSQWKTKKKDKKKNKWPTAKPTNWPTPEPTDWPTPEPTEWPTPEPTEWPTPEPTEWPTPEPTAWPTPEPTEWPTPEPTEKNWKKDKKWDKKNKKDKKWDKNDKKKKDKKDKKWGKKDKDKKDKKWDKKDKKDKKWGKDKKKKKKKKNWPTPKPTKKWQKNKKWNKGKSKSSDYGCAKHLRDGEDLDYVLFIDGSCGLTKDQSSDYLEGIGEMIYSILGDDTRVTTIRFGADEDDVKVLVDYKDDSKQEDAERYVKYIRNNGDLTKGGDGDTDLYSALVEGEEWLDSDKETKWIIVSACKHTDGDICDKAKKRNVIKKSKVDVYAVNLMNKSCKKKNGIKDEDAAEDYLKCLTDKDRVCVGNEEEGVLVFDEVIDDCLMPDICKPN